MTSTVRNIQAALDTITQPWQPHRLATVNDYDVKVVKLDGEFDWHSHADEDEAFLVIDGRLQMEFRDGNAGLGPGDLIVVPRGVEHRPVAKPKCSVVLFEPASTLNTGDTETDRTVHVLDRIS